MKNLPNKYLIYITAKSNIDRLNSTGYTTMFRKLLDTTDFSCDAKEGSYYFVQNNKLIKCGYKYNMNPEYHNLPLFTYEEWYDIVTNKEPEFNIFN